MVKVEESPGIASQLLARVVRPQVAPDAAAGVAWKTARGEWCAQGGAAFEKPGNGLLRVFDLASLTKPVTALTALRLQKHGTLQLSDRLDRWLPEATGREAGAVSLESLLAHRSGLVAHRDFFAPLRNGGIVSRAQILQEAAGATRTGPETTALYSDLGYLLVGCALENATGLPLDELQKNEVSRPLALKLGSARQWSRGNENFRESVAPTECVGWRGGLIQGEVHDENAWALSGLGAAGHAGLFGTLGDVLGLGMAVLDAMSGNGCSWLTKDEIQTLTARRPGGTLRAGFDGKSSKGSSVGTVLGPNTVGHLGFTGTSVWCDPDQSIVVALLTNRVSPTRENPRLGPIRPKMHDTLGRIALHRSPTAQD